MMGRGRINKSAGRAKDKGVGAGAVLFPGPLSYVKKTIVFHTLAGRSIEYKSSFAGCRGGRKQGQNRIERGAGAKGESPN